jgi:hypothetical protein
MDWQVIGSVSNAVSSLAAVATVCLTIHQFNKSRTPDLFIKVFIGRNQFLRSSECQTYIDTSILNEDDPERIVITISNIGEATATLSHIEINGHRSVLTVQSGVQVMTVIPTDTRQCDFNKIIFQDIKPPYKIALLGRNPKKERWAVKPENIHIQSDTDPYSSTNPPQ